MNILQLIRNYSLLSRNYYILVSTLENFTKNKVF